MTAIDSPFAHAGPMRARLLPRLGLHGSVLAMSLAAIALSFALRNLDGEHVAFRFLPGWTLPQSCFSRAFFDSDCPGCGLTRSFICLAQGDMAGSWHFHRLGWLVALLVVAQIPYRLWAMRTGKCLVRTGKWVGAIMIALLVGNWLLHG